MKKLWLFGLLLLIGLPAGANDQRMTCLKNLPGMITIDPSVAEVNFVKSPGADSFWNFAESGNPEWGYMQHYQNNMCLARVYLYNNGYDKISLHRSERQAKAAMNFRLTRQTREKMDNGSDFILIEGFEGDLGNISMVGDYRNNFLKIRTTCALNPRLDQRANENAVRTTTVKLATEILRSLDGCFVK